VEHAVIVVVVHILRDVKRDHKNGQVVHFEGMNKKKRGKQGMIKKEKYY
jgi:hypothetical protein